MLDIDWEKAAFSDEDQSAMSIEISATYENGVLKLDNPIPLEEHQRVKVTVHEEISRRETQLWAARLDG